MGVDEEDTLAALKSLPGEIADPKINDYRGRIVKTALTDHQFHSPVHDLLSAQSDPKPTKTRIDATSYGVFKIVESSPAVEGALKPNPIDSQNWTLYAPTQERTQT